MPRTTGHCKISKCNGSGVCDNIDADENGYANTVLKVFAIIQLSEKEVSQCPQIEVNVGKRDARTLIDSGSEVNLIDAGLLQQLIEEGLEVLSLPISGCIIKGAFQSKAQRIKSQILVDIYIDGTRYEVILLVAPKLSIDIILGMEFLKYYRVSINFEEEYFETTLENTKQRHNYSRPPGRQTEVMSIRAKGFPCAEMLCCAEENEGFYDRPSLTGQLCKQVLGCPDNCGDRHRRCNGNARKNELRWRGGDMTSHCDSVRVLGEGTERDKAQDALINVEFNEGEEAAENGPRAFLISQCNMFPCSGQICHATRLGADRVKMSCSMRRETLSPHEVTDRDPRDITVEGLKAKTSEAESLNPTQQIELFNMLLKYKGYFSSRPGRCRNFTYAFEVKDKADVMSTSRLIPFKLRHEVREQIQQLLADGVIEHSSSSYVNPLTIVPRPGKAPRICLDARRVNLHMTPDRTKIPPVQELIQQFFGAKFITSIDLSSAFLQINLHEECRKFTAFVFENEVYQFTRVPFGLKNSLSGFIRALNSTLGTDCVGYAIAYVDDLVVFSPTFEQHLQHLEIVIGKLTAAGFTINASKCSFCRREITFLGHHKPDQTVCKTNRWKVLGEKRRLLCKDSSATLSGDPLSRRCLPQDGNKLI
jgi:predicted aspartyl protease